MRENLYYDKYLDEKRVKRFSKKTKKKYILKKRFKKVVAIGLSFSMLFGVGKLLFKDDKKDYTNYSDTTTSNVDDSSESDIEKYYTYSIEQGEDDVVTYKTLTPISVDKTDIENFKNYLNNSPVKYTYEELFNIDESYKNYNPKDVSAPESSKLLVNGKISADALYKQVLNNNDMYYGDSQNNNARAFSEKLKDDEIKDICIVITDVINYEVQKEGLNILEVCKNLEHLKIFQRKAQFENASLGNDTCFFVNKRFIEKIFKVYSDGRDCYDEAIVHEVMHLIQYFTSNLNDTDGKEMGPFISYVDSDKVNPLNITWILESNAEIEMSLYTGNDITTYATQVGYLNSVNLALSSSKSYKTNAIYTISYAKNWDVIYDLFGAKTEQEKKSIMKCLYSIEVSQTADSNFYNAYKEKYKVDISNNDDLKQEVKKTCAREALLELSRIFYKNMCDNLDDGSFYLEDVFYLIRLWESDLLYHLDYNLEEQYLVCKDFITEYNDVQGSFFKMLADCLNCSEDYIYEEYNNYSMKNTNGNNFSLSIFDNEKKQFLLEIRKERYQKGNPRISNIDTIMVDKEKEFTY